MAIAAFILSILAVAAADFAAFYTSSQASAAQDERHDARTPQFQVTAEWIDPSYISEVNIVFQYIAGPTLDTLSAALMLHDDPNQSQQRWVPFPSWTGGQPHGTTLIDIEPMRVGQTRRLRANFNKDAHDDRAIIVLKSTAVKGRRPWSTPTEPWSTLHEVTPPIYEHGAILVREWREKHGGQPAPPR